MNKENQSEELIERNPTKTTNLPLNLPRNSQVRPSQNINSENTNSKSKLGKLVLFTFTFMIVEFIGGYMSNSVAIISDALHMGADTIGYTIQLISVYLSIWQPNKTYSFGFKRGEVIGGLLNCLIIWSLTIYLLIEAVHRIIYPPTHFNHRVMLFTAFLGVCLNLTMGGILVGFNNIHRIFKFWESDTEAVNGDHKDYNVRITIVHIRGDMAYSVGVLISSILINCFPNWLIIDSFCTILFSFVVIEITQPIVVSVTRFLFEAVPESCFIRH